MTLKPLTKADLISTLKTMNLVTRDDIKNMVVKDDIKNMVVKDDIKNMVVKDDIKNFATKDDIKASEGRLKLIITKVKNDLALRIAKVATESPTYRDFQKLKQKVEESYTS